MAVVIQEGDEKTAVDPKEESNLQAKSHGYLMDVKELSVGRSSAAPNDGDVTRRSLKVGNFGFDQTQSTSSGTPSDPVKF